MAETTTYRKTECKISRKEFAERAKQAKLTLEYDGKTYTFAMDPMEYKTGSLGWNLSDKATFTLDGRDVKVQIGLNVTAIASKDLPRDDGKAAA